VSRDRSEEQMQRTDKKLARFLGVLSLGLGVPQALVPDRFLRFVGVHGDEPRRFWRRARKHDRAVLWTRLVGVRELVAAVALLSRPRPVGWLWARVAGDVKDLVLLASSLPKAADRRKVVAAHGAVVGVAALDVLAAASMSRTKPDDSDDPTHVTAAITVARSPEEAYSFWRDFTNLPRFMAHLESVEPSGNGHTHWRAKAPIGHVEWDAEVVENLPGRLIAWRSVEGASVANAGKVRFDPAPGDAGTEIRVDMRYAAPGGVVGTTVAKLMGEEPQQQVEDDLRRFKQVIEAGEVVRSDGSPEGALARRLAKQRPAHPMKATASSNGGQS
jgi:uncharacterized membrane protein